MNSRPHLRRPRTRRLYPRFPRPGHPRPRRRRGDEQGATLILAMFFVVIFSLVVVTVLSAASAGLKAAGTFADQGKQGYSADGATQVAISNFAQGNPCADYTSPSLDGQQMIVHCDHLNASSGNSLTAEPQDALLSLGQSSENGIDVTTPGLRVQGNVFSNSNVATDGGSMTVSGNLSAVGDCSAAAQTLTRLAPGQTPYVRDCANSTPAAAADPVVGADPDYTPPATAVPVLRTVPACPASGSGDWLVKLLPGYYDDAAALNSLTGGDCPGVVVWLQPGTYYFDFTFTGATGANAAWTVTDPTVSVVGGTPTSSWNPDAATRPVIPDPGGCDTSSPDGVEVMMGGGSRFQVDRGHAELCAPVTPGGQQVAVYGVQPSQPSHMLKPTAVVQSTGFTNAVNALTIGEAPSLPGCASTADTVGCTADAALDPVAHPSASVELGGFAPQVAPGSVISKVTLLLDHEDSGDLTAAGAVTATTGFTGDTCGTDAAHSNGVTNLPLHPTALTEDSIDLTACGLTDPAQLSGLTVTYTATLDAGGGAATDRLDGIWLDVSYRTPTTFKPTAVAASTGFTNPDNALEIGEQPTPDVASAALSATAPAASITLAGYGQPPIPPGSKIDSAVLRVAHQETGDAAAPTVSVTPAGGGGTCTGKPLTARAGLGDDRVDLTACGITDPAQLTGLTATYAAALTAGGTAGTDSLDGMWLEVVYDPPPTTRPATSAASTTFTNPDNAETIDGAKTADATLGAAPATPTASIALGGYDTPAVPPGSVLDRAVLNVAHQDVPGAAGPAPTVAVTLTGPDYTGPCTTPQDLAAHPATLGTDTLDLVAACKLTDPAQLTGLTVAYTATLGAGSTAATDHLDGITLDLAYRPPIAVAPTTATSTATPTTAQFANPDNAEAIGGPASGATLATATPSASIQLGGFTMLPLPAGAVIDKVVLRVAHQDDDTTPAPSPPTLPPPAVPPATTLTVSGTGTACDASHPLAAHQGAEGADVVDLGACGVSTQAQLDKLAVSYAATLGTGSTSATDQLDGVELDIVFRAPSIEPLSGCLTAAPYPATGGSCAVLESTDTADTAADHSRLVIDGTVYAPSAAVDLSMSQVSSQVVTRGIIARTIDLGISPATSYRRPVIGIPPEPVLFTTYPAAIQPATSFTANTGFTTPDAGETIDKNPAVAPLGSGGQASLTLGGYAQPPPTVAGKPDHVVLRVAHEDDGDVASVSVSVALGGSTCDTLNVPVHPGPGPAPDGTVTPVVDQFDITEPCGLTAASQLAGLTVTYTVTAGTGGSATDYLDGTQFDVLANPLIQAAVSFNGSATTVEQWTVLR